PQGLPGDQGPPGPGSVAATLIKSEQPVACSDGPVEVQVGNIASIAPGGTYLLEATVMVASASSVNLRCRLVANRCGSDADCGGPQGAQQGPVSCTGVEGSCDMTNHLCNLACEEGSIEVGTSDAVTVLRASVNQVINGAATETINLDDVDPLGPGT